MKRYTGRSARPLVSVCYITKNEERFIERSIASTKGLADEVLVGDTGSTDATREIAQKCGAVVFPVPWEDHFAKARNAVVERAQGKWIVQVDGDEWFAPGAAHALRARLEAVDQNPAIFALDVVIVDLNDLDTGAVLDRFRSIRVFRNIPQHRYAGRVHEQIYQSLRGAVGHGLVELVHAGYAAAITQEKNKGERNAHLLDLAIAEEGEQSKAYPYLLMQRGREHQRVGALDSAMEMYEKAYDGAVALNAVPSAFTTALFSYGAEVLTIKGLDAEVFGWCNRLAPLVPLPQSELSFYRGYALMKLGRHEEACSEYAIAVACIEGAGEEQEVVSRDHAVLSYTALAGYAKDPVTAFGWALRGLQRVPAARLLGEAVVKAIGGMPATMPFEATRSLPTDSLGTVANAALLAENDTLCAIAANEATRRGVWDCHVWAAASALRVGKPQIGQSIAIAVPEGHPSKALALRLEAMAAYAARDTGAYQEALDEMDSLGAKAVHLWAEGRIDAASPEEVDEATRALLQLTQMTRLPFRSEAGVA